MPDAFHPSAPGVFLGLGLSVVPTMHFTVMEGRQGTTVGQMGWFFLMAVMYITGAGLYAHAFLRRFFPGKFDIWVNLTLRRAVVVGLPEGGGRGSEAETDMGRWCLGRRVSLLMLVHVGE